MKAAGLLPQRGSMFLAGRCPSVSCARRAVCHPEGVKYNSRGWNPRKHHGVTNPTLKGSHNVPDWHRHPRRPLSFAKLCEPFRLGPVGDLRFRGLHPRLFHPTPSGSSSQDAGDGPRSASR